MARAAITGASSGLGKVFAQRLAARGYNLVLIARRKERLDELARELMEAYPIAAEVLAADLAQAEDLRKAAARLEEMPDLTLLVNNAGFGTRGRFWETDFARQEEMHRVHVTATMTLTRAALTGMTARDEGGIINVSSVAGFFRSGGNTSYCATKAWINGFSESLYLELQSAGSRVAMQALCPGFTYTEFHATLGMSRDGIPKSWWMPAEFVVDESLKGLEARKLYVIPGWRYKLLVAVGMRLPTSWRMAMQRKSSHQREAKQ
jgi:uncharacterized protein